MAPKVAEKEFKKLEIFLPREFSGRPNGGKKSFVFALFVATFSRRKKVSFGKLEKTRFELTISWKTQLKWLQMFAFN
jgi:hypothetical protein